MYNTEEKFNFKFEVKKITFSKDEERFKIIKGKIIEHDYSGDIFSSEITIQGTIPSAIKGDTFRAVGQFKIHKVYGPSIHLVGYPVATLPQVKKGIMDFLRKRVKGLGTKTSKAIVEELGLEAISKIENDYKCLLGIKGISVERAKKIHEHIAEHRKFEDVALFAQSNSVEYQVALRVYDTFKNDSIAKIKENPYSITFIPKVDFKHADKFAFNMNFPSDNPSRIKSGILFYLNYRVKNHGDLCVFKQELLSSLDNFLIKYGEYPQDSYISITEDAINKSISELLTENLIVIERNNMGADCVYRKDYNIIENQIIKNLKTLLSGYEQPFCSRNDIKGFLSQYEANNITLAEQQREGVYMALMNRMSVLTGFPGTGKTQTTNTIVKCIKYIKPNATITLLAPTGKASRRMTELTSMEASTIHKGIGLNGFNDESELEEIDDDFVIIDESSMVDAFVFNALISNIGENTRILFVGDYEQLPSVGPGLILRDLINSGRIPVVTLTEIFRQAQNSQIVMNSHAIIKGQKDRLTFDIAKGDFYFLKTASRTSVKDKIIKSIENMIKNQGHSLSDISVLSPMKDGEIGVRELNKVIQKRFNPPSDKPDYYIDNLNCLRVGDRVMQTVNNYDIKVMNGDVGIIESIYTDEGEYVIEVSFPDKTSNVEYTESTVIELELAYAMTIHKSQGSEFPVVIMPIHGDHSCMLSRNLVYTAVTRAKKTVVLIGTLDALYDSMGRKDGIARNSRIKEKLQKEVPALPKAV